MSERRRLLEIIASQGKWLPYSFEYLYHSLIPQTISGKNVKNKAKAVKIYGNSEVENQLIDYTALSTQTKNGITCTNNNDGSFTLSGGVASATSYFLFNSIDKSVLSGKTIVYGFTYKSRSENGVRFENANTGIGTATNNLSTLGTLSSNYASAIVVNSGTDLTTPIKVIPILSNLTQRYPFDTPTTLTDNRVQNIINRGYIPFNSGEIKNVDISELMSEPFNIWDEQWEQGYINANGVPASASRLRSKNFINVVGGKEYCYYCSVLVNFNVFFYDNNYNFISSTTKTNSASNRTATITTPNNVFYVKFYLSSEYGDGTTYNNDICINVSSSLNGTYKPHTAPQTIPFKYQGGGVGTSHDTFEITNTECVFTKDRAKYTFNGSETWYESGQGYYTRALVNSIKSSAGNVVANILCNIFMPSAANRIYSGSDEKSIGVNDSSEVWIRDTTNITSTATAQSYMSGKTIEYQLATPQVITIPRKHLGIVDLGSLNWVYNSTYSIFTASLSNAKPSASSISLANIYCHLYLTNGFNTIRDTASLNMQIGINTASTIGVRNLTYTNATDFKNAMSGQYFYYETENEVADIFDTIGIEAGGTLTSNWFSWVENQLVSNGNFESTNNWQGALGTISASGNVITYEATSIGQYNYSNRVQQNVSSLIVANHKYLMVAEIKSANSFGATIGMTETTDVVNNNITTSTTWQTIYCFGKSTSASDHWVQIKQDMRTGNVGDTYQVRNVRCFDLTLGEIETTNINDPRIQEILRLGYIPTNTTGTLKHIDPIVLPNADTKLKSK